MKRKIINDPVFGFINIPNDFILNIISHPYFQRLDRIKQLGLSSFVYPGAQHSRLIHSLGTMHLMSEAIKQIRLQGHNIDTDEENGAMACALLHDIGHGPFSHTLEHTLIKNVRHEDISLLMMNRMNKEMNNQLDTAIRIFKDEYQKKFLHQLVSSQLDMDRMDYLSRDSFFCGVSEGIIGTARIIKMLDVHNDQLVVEAKGIYSIEKFLVSRRLMYWQVYLHKTCVAAERMLLNILKRAKELAQHDNHLFAAPALEFFLYNTVDKNNFDKSEAAMDNFILLDDTDILSAIKTWSSHSDIILSTLCKAFVGRKLFKVETQLETSTNTQKERLKTLYMHKFNVNDSETDYFMGNEIVSTDTYNSDDDRINILYKDGTIKDISEASDMLNIEVLSKKAEKNFFIYMKPS